MRSYRVGVVGLRRGLGPARVFDLMPDCRVVAGCDISPAALEQFGALFPQAHLCSAYDEMLAQGLDIVFVASPVPLHCQHTVAALDAGCHVLQEVTLASTLEECRKLLAAVQAHPRQKFMLAENCCYWAHILSWREMWGQGLLGDFMYAEAEYIHDTRFLLREADGSITWRASMPPIHYCTHSLGPLLKVTGERCVAASGMSVTSGSGNLPARVKSGTEVAILQTASGGVIKILVAFRHHARADVPLLFDLRHRGRPGDLAPPDQPAADQRVAGLGSASAQHDRVADHRERDRRAGRGDTGRTWHRRVHDGPGFRGLYPRRYAAATRHPRCARDGAARPVRA